MKKRKNRKKYNGEHNSVFAHTTLSIYRLSRNPPSKFPRSKLRSSLEVMTFLHFLARARGSTGDYLAQRHVGCERDRERENAVGTETGGGLRPAKETGRGSGGRKRDSGRFNIR